MFMTSGLCIIGSKGPNTGTLRAARNSSAALFRSAVYWSGGIVGSRCCARTEPASSMVLRNMVNAAARRSMGCLLFAFKTVPPRPGKCRISILMRGLQSCCWQAAYFHQLPDGTHKGGGSADAPTPCPIVLRRLENGGGTHLNLAGFSGAQFMVSEFVARHVSPM